MSQDQLVIIEDDKDILTLLEFTFGSNSFEVRSTASGEEGLELIKAKQPDALILDLMLPDMSGFDVCRALKSRQETVGMPIIMLTARGDEIDRIVGLELGADDYVVKPFSPRELVLRVRAVLKRSRGSKNSQESSQIEAEGIAVDCDAHTVFIDGEEAALTATEFRLLVELLHNRGRVRTREQLLNSVWGYSFEGYARTVDTHVRRLRLKLGRHADRIETIRAVGYRFKE